MKICSKNSLKRQECHNHKHYLDPLCPNLQKKTGSRGRNTTTTIWTHYTNCAAKTVSRGRNTTTTNTIWTPNKKLYIKNLLKRKEYHKHYLDPLCPNCAAKTGSRRRNTTTTNTIWTPSTLTVQQKLSQEAGMPQPQTLFGPPLPKLCSKNWLKRKEYHNHKHYLDPIYPNFAAKTGSRGRNATTTNTIWTPSTQICSKNWLKRQKCYNHKLYLEFIYSNSKCHASIIFA